MLPETMNWDEIKELYEKAKYNLVCPKHVTEWTRDEKNGYFYLWNAYHYATKAYDNNPDHVTFAHILDLLSRESRYHVSDYERLHKYIIPAVTEYEKAMKDGQALYSITYQVRKQEMEELEFKFKHETGDDEIWDEVVSIIENGNLLDEHDFYFHDSRPVYFEQKSDKEAILKLEYNREIATLHFLDLEYIEIITHPDNNWVGDYYCYRSKGSKYINFNVGEYSIRCAKIILEGIEKK